ncbi:MAG: beta-glucosidase [Thermoflavifilum sp.]|nr:beta-glucosidase [Thermoflavifilum sp.]
MLALSCAKQPQNPQPQAARSFQLISFAVDGQENSYHLFQVSTCPQLKLVFNHAVSTKDIFSFIFLYDNHQQQIPLRQVQQSADSILVLQPQDTLHALSKYFLVVQKGLPGTENTQLDNTYQIDWITAIDSTDKFPHLSDSALLTLVEQQTFRYFWDFAHPVSGLIRERSSAADVCATGATGFGIMAILVGIERNFISRTDGLHRIAQIVDFLSHHCTRYHGAFSHWINGATGETIPFSTRDDGADLVETSYLMMGLLCARQYFQASTVAEQSLRQQIDSLWDQVEWTWFQQNGQSVLYWHWSPNYGWAMQTPIQGWNEALITYVLAAASRTHAIDKKVYDSGWARNGNMRNGNTYEGIVLPLGPAFGGPLFFAHYTFLGVDPHGLADAYADYWQQNVAHANIQYAYCKRNPLHFNGYSSSCWGLTASDDLSGTASAVGYAVHSPTNDDGVIAPTAAVSSLPYTPAASMQAIRFYYDILGDKLWGDYGFKDAFNLSIPWFDTDYVAIDQAPQIIMIENYRSGLLWHLFMSCPEVQLGLQKLGFTVR